VGHGGYPRVDLTKLDEIQFDPEEHQSLIVYEDLNSRMCQDKSGKYNFIFVVL
jgi:hypothetical protein